VTPSWQAASGTHAARGGEVNVMLLLVLLAIAVVVLFGAGFALHLLWWVAIAALVLLVLGFLFRGGRRSGTTL
jgi:predicted membrane protein